MKFLTFYWNFSVPKLILVIIKKYVQKIKKRTKNDSKGFTVVGIQHPTGFW